MSQKEIDKKHGPVSSWNMTHFYSWDEFKQMPPDIQVEWVNYVMDKYNVGLSNISKDVFGRTHTALGEHLRKYGLDTKLHTRKRGLTVHPQDLDNFRDAVLEFWEGPKEKPVMSMTYDENRQMYNPIQLKMYHPISEEEFKMAEPMPEPENPSEPDSDPVHLSMAFSTSYISRGIDLSMLPGIAAMFEGKMVHVTFEVSII